MGNNILLFGGNGQVGRSLLRLNLPDDWQIFAPSRSECDFMKPGDIAKIIRAYEPHLVINCAAVADIEICQNNPDMVREVNFHAVANIAGQCSQHDAPLIQISTDYVFDGTQNSPYGTDDAMNPLNVYGETKLLGEEAARHGLYWHVIIRTSLVFSAFGKNVLTKTLQQINTQDVVQAAADQTTCPTSAEALAQGIMTIANAILQGKGNGFGTFHISGDRPVTRFEFLQAMMEAYAPYTDRRPVLEAVLAADVPNRIPRPACTILNNEKTRETYGIAPCDWRVDLAKAVKDYVEGKTA